MKGTYIWKKDDWSSSGLVANNHVAKSTHFISYLYLLEPHYLLF